MDSSVTSLVLPVAAACVGGVIGWVASTSRSRVRVSSQLVVHERTVAELNSQLQAQIARRATLEAEAQRTHVLDEQLRDRIAEVTQLTGTIGRIEAELASEQRNHAEERERITEMQEQLTTSFRSLSSQALASNNQQFLDLAKSVLTTHHERAQGDLTMRHEAIELLVKPLHDSLKGVEQQVGDMEKTRLTAQATLIEQVRSLETTAGTLATALRAPKARGRWGELQLRRVVELAGMVDRCDFVEQTSTATETGRLQPDMIVHLAGGKDIVLDAKTPMDAYLRAIESTDPEARIAGMKEHALRVKQHVVELSRKSYWKQLPSTPELVVLFLPGEDLFSAALEHEPGLIEFGVEQNV
ncbi:MAG: DNA recombination protein RmuC, partial [Thermoleophilia bacterium]|nr:DNA recombination protein RmuC [Thermoleophilia bacterium]